jgi:threonine/homoserine/homoserine lactone efflux protein
LIVTLSTIPGDLFVAWVSGSAARMVAAKPRLVRIQEYVSGGILVGLGLYVAQTERAN